MSPDLVSALLACASPTLNLSIHVDICCRLEPNEPVSLVHLQKLGVVYWKVDGEVDPKLQAIRDARGYSYKV